MQSHKRLNLMMRTLFLAGLFLWAGLAQAQPGQYLDVTTATSRRLATVRARAQGGLGDDNLHCTVVNLTRKELRLRVPPGLHFTSADAGAQDLFTFQEKLLVLASRDSARVRLRGFCMERYDYSPRSNTVYACSGLAGKGLQPLGDSLQKYSGLAEEHGQMFVWALSDQSPMRDVYAAPALFRGAANILRYIGSVTGQTRAQARKNPSARSRPRIKTFAKRVNMLYHNPNAQLATLKVYGADGGLVDELFTNRKLQPGVVRYTMGINMVMDAEAPAVFTVKLLGPAGQVLKEMKVDETTSEEDTTPTRRVFSFDFTLAKPLKEARFRVRLADGTLVEELMRQPYLPVGKFHYQLAFNHLYPVGTAFVARLENAAGLLIAEQPIASTNTP